MTPIQPTLDGSMPDPPRPDYVTWANEVRPAFVEAAQSGRRFTTYEIAQEQHLPEPPKPASDWGNFAQALRRQGLIEDAGADRSARRSSERSRVGVWRGTHAAQAGRIA